jgi:SpoVK/Ycf46/Vps4 family AAA+-type ATPase
MLIHGAAGVGKTSLISLLQKRLKTHLIATLVINCSDLTVSEDRHFAEIEHNLSLAKSMQPSILVLDGLEAIVRRVDLNSAEGSAIEAVKTEHCVNFLMQVLESLRAVKQVKMMFTARDIAQVPERMLETGICDTRISIQPPDLAERLELLAALVPHLAEKESFAQATQSYLPIDLLNIVRNAKLQLALHSNISLQAHLQTLLPTFIPQALQALPQVT